MKIPYFLADAQGIAQIFSSYDSSPDICSKIIGRYNENGTNACFPVCLQSYNPIFNKMLACPFAATVMNISRNERSNSRFA